MSSLIERSVATRRHAGPRNIAAICKLHAEENGARPSTVGLKGDAKKNALTAQKRWDSSLMGRSTVISEAVNNGVCRIDNSGMVVRA
jgi:hypothetical protein